MSSTSPLVSVVVPVYRTEAYLEGCLASLLGQTLRDIELIVVDDDSPGDVVSVVARAAAGDSRIRVLRHPENRGVGLARVTGARAARGRYLALVDSDDEVSERFLECSTRRPRGTTPTRPVCPRGPRARRFHPP